MYNFPEYVLGAPLLEAEDSPEDGEEVDEPPSPFRQESNAEVETNDIETKSKAAVLRNFFMMDDYTG